MAYSSRQFLILIPVSDWLGCCQLKVWSLFSTHIFKDMMNNYAWTLIIWWKRIIFIYFIKYSGLIHLNCILFAFKICFSFSFCSDFNLETAVVKTGEIRGLKQLFTPCFLLIGKKIFFQSNNNYCIVHQKNHIKNNNDQTFNKQWPYLFCCRIFKLSQKKEMKILKCKFNKFEKQRRKCQ